MSAPVAFHRIVLERAPSVGSRIHANSHLPRDHLRYDTPPTGVTQMLRLTPRDHDGQHVVRWRIDLSEDCLLHQQRMPSATSSIRSPPKGRSTSLTVEVDGEVETQDTDGLVSGAVERFPPQFYLARDRR